MQDACDVRVTDLPVKRNRIEVDTSSSRVPVGFLEVSTGSLCPGEAPDSFWARCLGLDSHVDVCSEKIQTEEQPKLDEIFTLIFSDLRNVNAQEAFELPVHIQESFALLNCCEFCCGSVLLLRTINQAYYIHWHRES